MVLLLFFLERGWRGWDDHRPPPQSHRKQGRALPSSPLLSHSFPPFFSSQTRRFSLSLSLSLSSAGDLDQCLCVPSVTNVASLIVMLDLRNLTIC
uniref:Uncharacterized protein n=1 Tax=Anguilla anguilla TaxID=7936 RepID=A0A0E9X2S4_ANGAN